MDDDYSKNTGESYIPQECEFFGFDETGGLDADGKKHCFYYIDSNSE